VSDPRAPVLDWIHTQGRFIEDAVAFVEGLAAALLDAGVPVGRITTGVPILHPQIDTSSVVWTPDGTEERSWTMKPEFYKQRRNSPLHAAYFEGRETRVPITPEPVDGEFGIVPDLREAGMTDYVVLPAPFSDGSYKALTFATSQSEGFTDEHLSALRAIIPALSMVLETQLLKRTARTLLDTYLGTQAGEQVLAGRVRRGYGEQIHAVIWFCDLRRSTPLAEALDPPSFLLLLADYFDCMGGAILDAGGLVLRYIGDAVLAIFPIRDDGPRAACRAAIGAAREAFARLDALNDKRVASGQEALGAGVGLHLGDVVYGNIGTASRLEFTVIGSAANLAARVEGMCKTLDERLVFSQSVADQLEEDARSLGRHALRGVGEPIELFSVD
jgi:adenylate cyclase